MTAATSTAPLATSEVTAGGASFLPGKEFGIRIFAAGLVALAVSIGGLVILAVRRREE